MAKIRSGATTDELTVDATSKAARASLYDNAGIELFDSGADKYILRIPRMVGGTPAASSRIFAFRNLGTKTIRIRQIVLNTSFNGTAALTTQGYELRRFSGATPTGGTALVIIKKRTAAGATTVTDARFGAVTQTALTVTGITFEEPLLVIQQARQVGSAQSCVWVFPNSQDGFEIAVNEGLALQIELAAVAGDCISGSIEWDEL